MVHETSIRLADCTLFVRHNGVDPARPAVLFIHGLGENGESFHEAFDRPELATATLVIPDLAGYGRSVADHIAGYSYDAHIRRLWEVMDHLGIERFAVAGHSMGGDLGTYMASDDTRGRIRNLINIEGDLTRHDIFFSNKVVAAADAGDFDRWFEMEFREKLVLQTWGKQRESCRRYYKALGECRIEAFVADAREMFKRNQPLPGTDACRTGKLFASLRIPKIFCWGSDSLAEETRRFLETANIDNKEFIEASHWVMIDRADDFYPFLSGFLSFQ